MITLRNLLAGLAASMPRDEAQAVRTAVLANVRSCKPVVAPCVLVEQLVEERQAETLSLGS